MAKNVHGHTLRGWSRLADERGRVGLVTILLLLLVAVGVYFVVLLVPPYVEYYKFRQKMQAVANMAHQERDEEILKQELGRECKILGMDLPYDAITLRLDPMGKFLDIKARYVRVVHLPPFGGQIRLEFAPAIHETFSPG